MAKTSHSASGNGHIHPTRIRLAPAAATTASTAPDGILKPEPLASTRLSVNLSTQILKRVRLLAHTHRLSESSIVEVALGMFFARGDDAALGVILRQLGATLRRK